VPTGASGTYDDAGELTSSTLGSTTTSYAYNADGQRLTTKQGSTTITSGTWNGASELTSYNAPAADMSTASYDGDGLRASATFTPSGGSPTSEQYVWSSTGSMPQLLMDSGNAYIYASIGAMTPTEQVNLATGTVTYLVPDAIGSVRGTVNSSGTLTGSTSYDAWGTPETSGGLTAATPFGFASGYTDPTGIIYLTNRYYDPATGQFTSVDPALSESMQPYAYAGDDPVLDSDPTGMLSSNPADWPDDNGDTCPNDDTTWCNMNFPEAVNLDGEEAASVNVRFDIHAYDTSADAFWKVTQWFDPDHIFTNQRMTTYGLCYGRDDCVTSPTKDIPEVVGANGNIKVQYINVVGHDIAVAIKGQLDTPDGPAVAGFRTKWASCPEGHNFCVFPS